ncbi:hypothetical protein HHE02_01400 [Helicobacter heilmannii]|uniref:Uncharacterized protein n=1 Tax=Helicobacter heilmannii TaxID=35817 RepID=A0A0K2XJ01_HELHE|nr:hypothetical protein BN341_14850 [Helicobacter heilmannii ASB1.4]CRF45563.1 hypothetical protein HHE014_05280 [Helicobacter heilmannii]CRF46870.1 hypothetical protein HHE02_01400 [Helicobacter heilmannii]CRF50652.1 hypothetical protein HHE06_04930 [Helicobacter heilmannii]CRI34700.1 hypothetical protein HHE01_05010 [Helicobacter heilmannii]
MVRGYALGGGDLCGVALLAEGLGACFLGLGLLCSVVPLVGGA